MENKRERDIEYEVYWRMCRNCENAHYCHNACETCDEFAEELEMALNEQESEGNE